MKAIIPVAGAGTKLRPHTYTQPKSLIPVAGKPILSYIIDQLKRAGINDFVFVIGYLGEKIQEFIAKNYKNINAEFVVQSKREGLGQAIWKAHEVIDKGTEVVIYLGDTIIEADMKKFIQDPHSLLCIRKVSDPRRFGVAEFNDEGFTTRVVEKPKIPRSNMALVGMYKIKEFDALVEALHENIQKGYKTQNEYQLTDGIMQIIKQGVKFKGFKVDNWYDCGQKEVLLQINGIILKKKQGRKRQPSKGLENSIIVEPVHIGRNAVIRNSIIGPNVTIGDHARITNSIIEDSIIGQYTQLNQIVMSHSIVGSDSLIIGSSQSLNIGDNTELDLS